MSLIILFGFPGVGKTYVGKIFEKNFKYYFYEGDNDLTDEMKKAIIVQKVFTDKMRNEYFKILINKIQKLESKYQNLVVAQTFIKEKYRLDLIGKIPRARFILIETKTPIREKRLEERKDSPLEMEYARKMCGNFEKPKINHQIIINDEDGEENIKTQINLLLCNDRE